MEFQIYWDGKEIFGILIHILWSLKGYGQKFMFNNVLTYTYTNTQMPFKLSYQWQPHEHKYTHTHV